MSWRTAALLLLAAAGLRASRERRERAFARGVIEGTLTSLTIDVSGCGQ